MTGCEIYEYETGKSCRLHAGHLAPHFFLDNPERCGVHRNGKRCLLRIDHNVKHDFGWTEPKRCTARNKDGLGCGGPAGHDGQHGTVVRWSGQADPTPVDLSPNQQLVVRVPGYTMPVVVEMVDMKQETESIPVGSGNYVPGLRSLEMTVQMRSTGEVVRG